MIDLPQMKTSMGLLCGMLDSNLNAIETAIARLDDARDLLDEGGRSAGTGPLGAGR